MAQALGIAHGSIKCMAKEKATITVDRAKLAEARAMLGVSSASAAIDVALSELIRRARMRHDIETYTKTPLTDQEVAAGDIAPDWSDLADDTDWDAEWPEPR
jgi:Bacterial antitoxin of type II TA system, VapB